MSSGRVVGKRSASGRRKVVKRQPQRHDDSAEVSLLAILEKAAYVSERDSSSSLSNSDNEIEIVTKKSKDPPENRQRFRTVLPLYEFDGVKQIFVKGSGEFDFPYRHPVRHLKNYLYED
jgi:hypothetical protein